MSRSLIFVLGLLAILLLTLVCSCRVQADIESRAQASLDASHDWATATADGRNVLVSGIAPSQASVDAAVQSADVRGVRRVDSDVSVHTLTAADVIPVREGLAADGLAWVDAVAADRTLTLNGLASEAREKTRATEIAEPLWPFGPVDNRIRVASGASQMAAVACRGRINALLAEDTVQFESASAALLADSRALLDRIVEVLADCPESTIRIEAHSDNSGEAQMNLELSRNRAATVMTYLVGSGVLSENVTSEGFGETRPLVSNESPEGRAVNRRVEFKVDS